jgi:hypothetical protein
VASPQAVGSTILAARTGGMSSVSPPARMLEPCSPRVTISAPQRAASESSLSPVRVSVRDHS